jgi:pimeloyl-ACP methyl ester carboxylesterase
LDKAMPHLTTDDNVRLYYEEVGSGIPIVFVHEFAGDYRSWEPQLRYFARRYRAIAFNARGYPPSDVPAPGEAYSQARAAADIRCVLDQLKIDQAHVVGLSMGGLAVLHFGVTFPARARSLLVGGAGYGSERGERAKFRAEASTIADRLEREGMAKFAEAYAYGPRAYSSRARTRAGSPNSGRCWPSIPPRAALVRNSASSASDPRCSIWKTS